VREPVSEKLTPAGLRPDPLQQQLRVLEMRPLSDDLIFPFQGNEPRAAEQYRIIRTKLLLHPRPLRIVGVSSPQVGDGKSLTALNVAGALALKLDQSVLLVDGDFRRASLAEMLGVSVTPGLANVLAGECSWTEAVGRLDRIPNLYFLPAGQRPEHPAELYDSPAWPELCADLRRHFRSIIVDMPPVGMVADYDLIQAACDAMVLVVRPDHTNRGLCLKALEAIPPEKLAGVVINVAPVWFLTRRSSHGYVYYAGSDREAHTVGSRSG
jgi:capsular exopolysaccharide synthesis family protein